MRQRNLRVLPTSLQLNEFLKLTKEEPMFQQQKISNKKPGTSSFTRAENKLYKKLTHKNTHSKTEAIQRGSKYELPQINLFKNALVEMKSNEIQRSSKLIISSNKNTKILNDIIDILRDDKQQMMKKRESSKRNIKKVVLTEPADNQFLKNHQVKQKQVPTFQRGPKIVNPQFMKMCDGKLFSRRKIFSEERTRTKPKIKKSLNINIVNNSTAQQNPNLLTFYRPTTVKKVNTIEPETFKDIDSQQIWVQI